MQDYKKLQVWNRSHQLVLDLYIIVNQFPKEEKFGLISQIKRASSSIPANIAEGCGRNSNKDLAQFLNIALGSLNEVSYFVLLAKDLNYINIENFSKLTDECNEIKAMLISLIKRIRTIDYSLLKTHYSKLIV